MRLFPQASRIIKLTQRLAPFVTILFVSVWQTSLFAETLPTPSLTTPDDIHIWDFWDYVLFCTIFGAIVLLILTFAKKHDQIEL